MCSQIEYLHCLHFAGRKSRIHIILCSLLWFCNTYHNNEALSSAFLNILPARKCKQEHLPVILWLFVIAQNLWFFNAFLTKVILYLTLRQPQYMASPPTLINPAKNALFTAKFYQNVLAKSANIYILRNFSFWPANRLRRKCTVQSEFWDQWASDRGLQIWLSGISDNVTKIVGKFTRVRSTFLRWSRATCVMLSFET
jgi:hypothetical protein